MNIFSGLKVGNFWKVKTSRYLSWDEVNTVLYAEVVETKYWYSVAFHMCTGKILYIPMSTVSVVKPGDILNLEELKLITLCRDNEEILRIEA